MSDAITSLAHPPPLPHPNDHHLSHSTPDSSAAVSPSDEIENVMESSGNTRPNLGNRKSSGTVIAERNTRGVENNDDDDDDGDVRPMSPRRNSAEVRQLSDDARRDLIEQAKILQTSLQAIVERVETVREEHEKLEGGNKFLQSYIGELMQVSKITSSAPLKSRNKNRSTK